MTENIHRRPTLIYRGVVGGISLGESRANTLASRHSSLATAFQSLHFANRNRPKSMKTRRKRKFNRYTFTQFQGHVFRWQPSPEAKEGQKRRGEAAKPPLLKSQIKITD